MENFASLIRFASTNACQGKSCIFVSFKSAILSESQFRFVIHEGSRYTYTHTYTRITIGKSGGGVKRDFRDGKIFFHDTYPSSWETHIRICMRKGMASEEDCHGGFPLGFCFHRRGERNIGIESSSPFRALLAKSVVGPIYDDKGDGGGGGGRKEKEKKKGRTRATKGRRKVRRTETNGRRVEARGRGTRCEVNTGCPVNFIPKDWPRDALRFMECILVKIHSEMKGVLHITWKIARFLVKRMNSIVT